MRREIVALVLIAGCDKLLSLGPILQVHDAEPVDAAPDVAIDAPAFVIGCADGTREGFVDLVAYPTIAGCSGGWDQPGVRTPRFTGCPGAGNTSANPNGTTCSIADLCAPGWHVCATSAEVLAIVHSGGCGPNVTKVAAFFVTQQSSMAQAMCSATGDNDLFGCGTIGIAPASICDPLDRTSGDMCSALLPPWNCGGDSLGEALNVTKPGSDAGGALCCKD